MWFLYIWRKQNDEGEAVELVVERKSPEKEGNLMQQYSGTHGEVANLIEDYSSGGRLEEVLRSLEKKGSIYIERNPRVEDGVLRSDVRPSDVVFFDSFPSIRRKSLLYQTKVEYGDYTINHLLGCAHGCKYPCYAMNMSKRWGRIADYEDWMHPRIVGNALELLDEELPRLKDDIQFIHLSFMTDPFMYDAVNSRNFPWVEELTLRIIERVNKEGIKVTVLTKGLYPETLASPKYETGNEFGITLVSVDDDFHKRFEPYSAPPLERISALERLHDQGLETWVSLEPYPTPNIVKQDISGILAELSFVDKIVFGRWNYSSLVSGYPENEMFYRKHADEVIRFAKENDIAFHIKEGTPRSSTETEALFHN